MAETRLWTHLPLSSPAPFTYMRTHGGEGLRDAEEVTRCREIEMGRG